MAMTDNVLTQSVNGMRRASPTLRPTAHAGRNVMAAALLAVATMVSIVGCTGSESLTGPQSASLVATSTPSAAIIGQTTTRTPFEGEDENKCLPGELVPVHGSVAYSFFVSGTDVTHEKVKFSWVVDGTGSLSGSVYHGSEEYLEEINVSILPMEQTFAHNVHMVSLDKSVPDYFEKMLFHLTISGSGDVAAVVERGPTVECRT
jgi:hypothetical protein